MAESEAAYQLRSRFIMNSKELNEGKPCKSTQRAQLTRLIQELEREEKSLVPPEASLEQDAPPVIGAEFHHEKTSRHAIGYAALLLTLALLVFAITWMRRDFTPAEAPEWKPAFTLAEVAREKGELYDAKGLYLQAGRFAARSDDWAGLLAAACGLDKLETKPAPYSSRDSFLLRAISAAEKKQSRAGMTAIARAFTLVGERQLASVALSRVRENWPAENSASTDIALPDCWKDMADHRIDLTGE
jgi:hypothetical protein